MTLSDGKIVTRAAQLAKGSRITVRFKDGNATAVVEEIES
jgi:exodeoxyribonuclease VII large subunit